jgi:hypothetical protein
LVLRQSGDDHFAGSSDRSPILEFDPHGKIVAIDIERDVDILGVQIRARSIRALANQLQEWILGRASGALRRRLQTLAGEFDRNGASFDPGVVLKTGTTLVRQWRGHAHSVLVREDGFEYEGQRYRSLTMIAERITGAHWSGPRFFGLTKRAGASVGAEAGR